MGYNKSVAVKRKEILELIKQGATDKEIRELYGTISKTSLNRYRRSLDSHPVKLDLEGTSQLSSVLKTSSVMKLFGPSKDPLDEFICNLEKLITSYKSLKAREIEFKKGQERWQKLAGKLNEDIEAMSRIQ